MLNPGGYSLIQAMEVCIAPKGMFFAPFGLKTGRDFAHFGPESGMVFEGTTGVYERICCFNSK